MFTISINNNEIYLRKNNDGSQFLNAAEVHSTLNEIVTINTLRSAPLIAYNLKKNQNAMNDNL